MCAKANPIAKSSGGTNRSPHVALITFSSKAIACLFSGKMEVAPCVPESKRTCEAAHRFFQLFHKR